ncbi:MAG: hypothetical protein M0Q12_05590 [Synergistaceae bacterium]|jgi:hypothetical protein|nr:hypothetical protein [Synergistaceae bacterium]
MLSESQIIKFQTLYKNRFGKEICKEEAYEQASALLRLVKITYIPMTEAEYEQTQKRRKETGDIKNI